MDPDTIKTVSLILLMFVPVLGITVRFALKPVTDSVLKVMQARRAGEEMQMLERRVQLMEQELQMLRTEMQLTSEQKEFYRRLAESAPAAQLTA